MFPYIDNSLADNWLQLGAVTTTTTPTGIDITNAIGPVGLSIKIPSGGSGTLSLQPVMSLDNTTFVNVPSAAILAKPTGLPTTITNATSAGLTVTVYLKRDELYKYVSVLLTPVGAASQTVAIVELHSLSYTSTAV